MELMDKIFKQFDRDNDGFLNQTEIKHMLTIILNRTNITDDEVYALLKLNHHPGCSYVSKD